MRLYYSKGFVGKTSDLQNALVKLHIIIAQKSSIVYEKTEGMKPQALISCAFLR